MDEIWAEATAGITAWATTDIPLIALGIIGISITILGFGYVMQVFKTAFPDLSEEDKEDDI